MLSMFKVKPEDTDKKRAYFKNFIKTIRICACDKLNDTWDRIKRKTSADISYAKMSATASLDILYSDEDLDRIYDILQFIQVADENDLEALVVLYGDILLNIEKDIYNEYQKGLNYDQ